MIIKTVNLTSSAIYTIKSFKKLSEKETTSNQKPRLEIFVDKTRFKALLQTRGEAVQGTLANKHQIILLETPTLEGSFD